MLPNKLIAVFSSAFSLLWSTARESLVILQGKLPLHSFVVASIGDFFHKTSQLNFDREDDKIFQWVAFREKKTCHTYLSLMFLVVFSSSKEIVYMQKLQTYITSFYTKSKGKFEEHTGFNSYQALTYLLSYEANHNW